MRILLLLAALLFGVDRAVAQTPVELRVIDPLSGGAAFLGQAQQDSLAALQDMVNAQGGINGHPVHIVMMDDQSSPQVAVQLTTQIKDGGAPIFLGSTIVAMCNAGAPLLKNGPVMYCISPAFRPNPAAYTFSATASTYDLAEVMVNWLRQRGITKLALLVSTDATGQDAEHNFDTALQKPENSALHLTSLEHFNNNDVTVTAQLERIKDSGAQFLIAWTSGAPFGTVLKGMAQAGMDLPVGSTSANINIKQMGQYAGFLPKELYMVGGPYLKHDGVYKLDPRIEAVQHQVYAAIDARHVPLDNQVAQPWDAAMITIDALRAVGPDATKLRDWIADLHDYAGFSGMYDFRAIPGRGIGAANVIVSRYDPASKTFVWVSAPGGQPLSH
jgi:branched-chain amino acid transport system substrate-binding protein